MPDARERFSRTQRIRKRPDFVRIQDGGLKVGTRHFLILLAPARTDAANTTKSAPRLGVVASRKVGGAVQRNRAKRLVREVFRRGADLFPPGLDVVIIVRAGAHELSFAEADAELRAVAHLIRRRGQEALRAQRS